LESLDLEHQDGTARRDVCVRRSEERLALRDNSAVPNTAREDSDARIIITTIQKLSLFVARNPRHPVYHQHVVVIFDECHRSQFGDMHTEITRAFRRYHLFGFTGTPIFADNAGTSGSPQLRTTEQAFGARLHTYTIVDAINDKNVLPFRIDYINTIKAAPNIRDKKVSAIDTERALVAPERIAQVVGYVREHFDQKTKRAATYKHDGRRLAGFNSVFATASIDAAKRYYDEFTRQQKEVHEGRRLKVGLIYSFAANEDPTGGLLDEEEFETERLDENSRDFLDAAVRDYNAHFATSFDTSADKFQNYYKDLSQRLRRRELDLVIVVNMFLTGFDATTLNTLWVDKSLRAHGLIQAYSRTNRILNSVKTYGNIVSFRDLEQATNDALALFGNKDAKGIVLLKPYGEYYAEYQKFVADMLTTFPLGEAILGERAQKDFIKLFGAILRLRNILTAFDDFAGNEILSARDFQDFQSNYLNLYADFRSVAAADKETINDDVVFEIELIKQVEVNVDYILILVEQYLNAKGTGRDKEIRETIDRAVAASPSLRNKKDLIEQFVDSVSITAKVDAAWQAFIAARKAEELDRIIAEEGLDAAATRIFMENAFRDSAIPATGTAITKILPPVSRFSADDAHATKKRTILGRLTAFFERYFGLANGISTRE
jgi:type I restriction enzyme, R subunit